MITYVIFLPLLSMRDDISMMNRRLMKNVKNIVCRDDIFVVVVVVSLTTNKKLRSTVSYYVHLNEEST
jgi:hypothetical protein